MWDKLLLLIGPIVQLLNTILGYFKKSPAEERAKILEKNKASKTDFEKTGRPK